MTGQSGLIKDIDIIGQRPIIDYLRVSLEKNKLHQAYLIYGPEAIGKHMIGQWFVQNMLCLRSFEINDCDCQSCRSISLNCHPDYLDDFTKDATTNISIDAVRQLIVRLYQRPVLSNRVVALIPNIERLSESGINSILKTLEEPPGRAVIVMTTNRIRSVLPTLRSRCQMLRAALIPERQLAECLEDRGIERSLAARVARTSNGATGLAIRWCSNLDEFKNHEQKILEMDNILKASNMEKSRFVKGELAGKELSEQREKLNTFIRIFLKLESQRLARNMMKQDGYDFDRNKRRSVMSIRQAFATINALRKNFSPTLLFESFLFNYV